MALASHGKLDEAVADGAWESKSLIYPSAEGLL